MDAEAKKKAILIGVAAVLLIVAGVLIYGSIAPSEPYVPPASQPSEQPRGGAIKVEPGP